MRQMNSSPAEFIRALRLAFGAAVCEDATGVLLNVEDVTIHFALASETAHQIGALQIDSLRGEISVREGEESAAKSLLARVDRATLRGGG